MSFGACVHPQTGHHSWDPSPSPRNPRTSTPSRRHPRAPSRSCHPASFSSSLEPRTGGAVTWELCRVWPVSLDVFWGFVACVHRSLYSRMVFRDLFQRPLESRPGFDDYRSRPPFWYRSLCRHTFKFLSSRCPGVEFLGRMLSMCLIL